MESKEREYTVEVTAVYTITVTAASEEDAIDEACGNMLDYSADSIDGVVIG